RWAADSGRRVIPDDPAFPRSPASRCDSIGGVTCLDLVVQRLLLDVRQNSDKPCTEPVTVTRRSVKTLRPALASGQHLVGALVVMVCEGQLLQIVAALHATGCFAGRLNGR